MYTLRVEDHAGRSWDVRRRFRCVATQTLPVWSGLGLVLLTGHTIKSCSQHDGLCCEPMPHDQYPWLERTKEGAGKRPASSPASLFLSLNLPARIWTCTLAASILPPAVSQSQNQLQLRILKLSKLGHAVTHSKLRVTRCDVCKLAAMCTADSRACTFDATVTCPPRPAPLHATCRAHAAACVMGSAARSVHPAAWPRCRSPVLGTMWST